MRKTTITITAFALIVIVISTSLAPGAEPAPKPIKVAILVGGHGYDKKNFEKAWGGHEDIECEVWPGKPYTIFDDISDFKYDVVLMYNLSSGITDTQKKNFLALLKKGMGLVVWHHALANCQNWPSSPTPSSWAVKRCSPSRE